jgi:hypothetical protein
MTRIPVTLQDRVGALPAVDYRWDVDTDILTAAMPATTGGGGMTGSVEIEGADGSWLILDVKQGAIAGVEVAVWPDVKVVSALTPPADVVDSAVAIPARGSQPGLAALEVNTQLAAHADAAKRTIHFTFGAGRSSVVRAARDLLFELDERHHLVGLWLLNVPPFPSTP